MAGSYCKSGDKRERPRHILIAATMAGLSFLAIWVGDLLVPPHPRWWIGPAKAAIGSVASSYVWVQVARKRRGTA